MEADFLSLAARREYCNGTRYKREFQIAFPICTRGHGLLHTNERRCFNRYGSYSVPNAEWRTFVPASQAALLICSRPSPGLESSPQVIRLGADPWLLSL